MHVSNLHTDDDKLKGDIKMNYFNINEISTLEQLKKEYRKLARKFHPDISQEENATEHMQAINKEYETLFNQLKNSNKQSGNTKEHSSNFINIINDLIKYDNIIIDIVGSWLWVSGETYSIKDTLKKHGFRWSKAKNKWYLASEPFTKKRKSRMTYKQITDKYGKETVKTNQSKKLYIA